MNKPEPLPFATNGRVLWAQVPGFPAWWKSHAPNLSNHEVAAEVERRWGHRPSKHSIASLRATHETPTSPETRKRAYRTRQNSNLPPGLSLQEQMERRMLDESVQRLTRRRTFFELVGAKVIQAIQQLPSLPPVIKAPAPPKGRLEEEDAVLLVSDVQCGLTVGAEKSGGLGEYNHEVMLQEMAYLQDAIASIMRYHRNVRRLHVWFLGDIIEGEEIFEGQLRQIDMTVVEQTFFAVEQFALLLNNLSGLFREVRCVGIIGNHGRIGAKAGVHDPMSNWDYVVYRILAERLRPRKNVSWTIPSTWWHIAAVQGWRFLLAHGDESSQGGWGGIPFYGLDRFRVRYREMLRIVGKMPNPPKEGDFDYLCIGHFSRTAMLPWILLNGSWPGGTELSIKRMQMADLPQQTLFGVYRNYGTTWIRHVNLKPLARRDARGT